MTSVENDWDLSSRDGSRKKVVKCGEKTVQQQDDELEVSRKWYLGVKPWVEGVRAGL